MVCQCVGVWVGGALTKGEGQGGHAPWWAGPDGVANDNLNLVLSIGDESLELV